MDKLTHNSKMSHFLFKVIFLLSVCVLCRVGYSDVTQCGATISAAAIDEIGQSGRFRNCRITISHLWEEYDDHLDTIRWNNCVLDHIGYRILQDGEYGDMHPVFDDSREALSNSGVIWTVTSSHCGDPPPPCSTWSSTILHEGWGTVDASLPEGYQIRVYYILEPHMWDFFYGYGPRPASAIFGPDCWTNNTNGLEVTNWDLYLSTYTHCFAHTDIVIPRPAEIPNHPMLSFDGYVQKNGTSGNNWLPSPTDSLIGLAFSILNPSFGGPYQIRYAIWNISAWSGTCMNSPVRGAAPRYRGNGVPPHSDGRDYDFDFWVHRPTEYTLYAFDTLLSPVWYDAGHPLFGDSLPRGNEPYQETLKMIRADAGTVSGNRDTLWLAARDFAAHCVVTPVLMNQGKGGHIAGRLSSFGDTVWSVSVPRDDDARYDVGINWGDYMADAWEEQAFPGTDIRTVWPFYALDSLGKECDFDTTLRGRGVDGDELVNFEEYRGFYVTKDSTNMHGTFVHRRSDPLKKTVFVHFRPDIDTAVAKVAPDFIYKLYPSIQIFLTDSIRFERSSVQGDFAGRYNQLRWVDSNRRGAFYRYPPHFIPLSSPFNKVVYSNAATFWRWDRSDVRIVEGRPAARTIGYPPDSALYAWLIPKFVSRISINVPWLTSFADSSAYSGLSDPDFISDLNRQLKRIIAHEFGHTVGMVHPVLSDSIECDYLGFLGPFCYDSTGKFYFPSSSDSFNQQEKDSISVRRPWR